jgi:hypothetical protein
MELSEEIRLKITIQKFIRGLWVDVGFVDTQTGIKVTENKLQGLIEKRIEELREQRKKLSFDPSSTEKKYSELNSNKGRILELEAVLEKAKS